MASRPLPSLLLSAHTQTTHTGRHTIHSSVLGVSRLAVSLLRAGSRCLRRERVLLRRLTRLLRLLLLGSGLLTRLRRLLALLAVVGLPCRRVIRSRVRTSANAGGTRVGVLTLRLGREARSTSGVVLQAGRAALVLLLVVVRVLLGRLNWG